ncbi:serum amyloid A-5 protein-like [Ascaphus truei]|uniref:serum amyloid A-5 protein-like n=1 Tax=Ascaphus truei TaxID=8439 RepID=UPI003F5A732E
MKVSVCIFLLSLAVADAQWYADVGRNVMDAGRFVKHAAQGSWDMGRAYFDMRDANYKDADKYFHARGNYDAAQRGSGGRWAAEVLSDGRENFQSGVSGRGAEDTLADQEANRWGRDGRDPNKYRPKGLPEKY